MTTPTTIKAEYLRALAAEAAFQAKIDALAARVALLEKPPVPPPTVAGTFDAATFDPLTFHTA